MRYQNDRDGAANAGLVMGVLIVALGALLLLDNLGFIYVRHVWRFWPVVLVAVGFVKLLESQQSAGKLWGGIIMVTGGLLLADNLGYIHASFGIVWSMILVGVGLMLLLRTVERQQDRSRDVSDTRSVLNEFAIFGGAKRRVDSQDFKGGEALAIFGGCEIDLRQASISSQTVVDATAIFGGIAMRVPEDWSVTLQGVSIFGGYEDKTMSRRVEGNGNPKQLIVKGTAMFGGVTVEN